MLFGNCSTLRHLVIGGVGQYAVVVSHIHICRQQRRGCLVDHTQLAQRLIGHNQDFVGACAQDMPAQLPGAATAYKGVVTCPRRQGGQGFHQPDDY